MKTLSKFFLIGFILLTNYTFSQNYKLDKGNSSISFEGTSTMHDWHMDCEEIVADMEAILEDGKLKSLESVRVDIKVEGMKSGKGIMDDKTYDALKKKDHPKVLFRLTSIKSMNPASDGGYDVKAEGKLTIAGVTKIVVLDGNVKLLQGDQILIVGKYTLNMTTYDVEPPTALMGSIVTGEEVTVKFNTYFKPNL